MYVNLKIQNFLFQILNLFFPFKNHVVPNRHIHVTLQTLDDYRSGLDKIEAFFCIVFTFHYNKKIKNYFLN